MDLLTKLDDLLGEEGLVKVDRVDRLLVLLPPEYQSKPCSCHYMRHILPKLVCLWAWRVRLASPSERVAFWMPIAGL